MEKESWELLDIDDSDLSTHVLPGRLNPSSLILGPAGAVQAVMRNRQSSQPIPTQQFLSCVQGIADRVFGSNAWLSATEFVNAEGLAVSDSVSHGTPVNSIDSTVERVPMLVVVVKSSTPNGFGGLKVEVKDPTSSICGFVHNKIMEDENYGKQISDGCVLVLKEAVVFCPFPRHCKSYLNITFNNIVKVFLNETSHDEDNN